MNPRKWWRKGMTNTDTTSTAMRSVFITLFDKTKCKRRFEELNHEQKLITKNFIVEPARVKVKHNRKTIEKNRTLLNQQFPNFQYVTNRIFDNLLLTAISKTKGIKFRPMLLVGKPGIGKTYYTAKLAELLAVPKVAIDFATASAGFVLTGTSSKWGNSSVGVIAKLLMTQKICNGIVVLDEIDKTRSSFTNAPDPLNSLLSLLEQHSAKVFTDEFLEFSIDASEISYIATANNVSEIPDYVLSRFEICHIQRLSNNQIKKVAKLTYTNLLTELEIEADFSQKLSQQVISEIANVADVRQLKSIITNALILAVRDGRNSLLKKDMISSIGESTAMKQTKSTMGFIH